MNKQQLYALTGSLEQVASVRRVVYHDGKENGLCCAQVRSGPLEFEVMLNKCLDLSQIRYGGINFSFLSKTGLRMGDMCPAMFTAGPDNIHAARMVDGVSYPPHGHIRFVPAGDISLTRQFDGDHLFLEVSGNVSQAEQFGENIVLHRCIQTEYGTSFLTITDRIENNGFRPEPLCLLYHCNLGYPFLSPDCRVLLPARRSAARDALSHLDQCRRMDPPEPNAPEQVFQHVCACAPDGTTFAAIVNDSLNAAFVLRWNRRELPLLTQWKSIAPGDYAMALEPCNTGFEGREKPGEILAPFDQKSITLQMEILEGKKAIQDLEAACARLMECTE